MDSGKLVTLAMQLLSSYIIAVPVYAGIIKWLERGLAFKQAAMIAGVAVAISFALLLVYYIGRTFYDHNKDIDNLANFVAFCLTGILITRLARGYGVEKPGWLGVGGRANFLLMAMSWVVIFLFFGVQYLLSR